MQIIVSENPISKIGLIRKRDGKMTDSGGNTAVVNEGVFSGKLQLI